MDERFPKYLRVICRKLSFLAIPNLGMLLAGFAVLGFIGYHAGTPIDKFTLNPYLIMQGEFWRLVTFPVAESPHQIIWLFFHCLFIYFVMNSLEEQWGAGPLTIYTLFCYLCAIIGVFFLAALAPIQSVPVWQFVLYNMIFAFGTFFPDVEILLLVIPVKAKWLAFISLAYFLFIFVPASLLVQIFMLITILPYLLFFSPMFFKTIINKRKNSKRRKKFNSDMWK